MPRACATAEKLRKSQHMRKTRVSLLKMESVIGLLMVVLEADYFFSVMKLKTNEPPEGGSISENTNA
jgi:hypothetical protein